MKQAVGPQTYDPYHPTHVEKGIKFGKAVRASITKESKIKRGGQDEGYSGFPAPDTYKIEGDFEKAKSNPKFHMGIKYN